MQNQKPLIALTPYYNIEQKEPYMRPNYLKAIEAAGGIPVILPLGLAEADLARLADTFDGFMFTGGPDIHPFYFEEETHPHCGNVSLLRDSMELSLLSLVLKYEKPILGICRGIQLLNVGLGGNIYQDIPSQFPDSLDIAHSQPFAYEIPAHTVNVVPGTLLDKVSHHNSVLKVNSMHHQAVREPASGLIVSGYAPNQLIEAIEKPDYPFFLGVQWHPEYLWSQDPAAAGIFSAFITASCRCGQTSSV